MQQKHLDKAKLVHARKEMNEFRKFMNIQSLVIVMTSLWMIYKIIVIASTGISSISCDDVNPNYHARCDITTDERSWSPSKTAWVQFALQMVLMWYAWYPITKRFRMRNQPKTIEPRKKSKTVVLMRAEFDSDEEFIELEDDDAVELKDGNVISSGKKPPQGDMVEVTMI